MKRHRSFLALLAGILMLSLFAPAPAYCAEEGKAAVTGGWRTASSGKKFFLDESGNRVKGLQKIGNKWYYFSKQGYLKTGWRNAEGRKYYFDPQKDGARARGWTDIGSYRYYFKKNGRFVKGWLKEKGRYYYFRSNGTMVRGWRTIGKKRYYFWKKTGERAKGTVTIRKKEYVFGRKGTLIRQGFGQDGSYADASGRRLRKSTIKRLLQVALQPVGSTMYVWGGGWNLSDSGGDITARTVGVSPRWRQYFRQQTSAYDYRRTRYQIKDGLDCSGYVGWVIYNVFNTTSGNSGYVMLAQKMASVFAGYGWGSYTPAAAVHDYRAGDIMSLASGHVYIVLGPCPDGSVVLLHSSPSGVMISGTATRSGDRQSQAVKLAETYMKRYYPGWYAKYPEVWRDASYLTRYSQMRWYLGAGKSMLSDPDGYTAMSAKRILRDLFSEG